MKALPAIYHEGNIQFVFNLPEIAGPISVLVIFPSQEEENPENPETDDEDFHEPRTIESFTAALETQANQNRRVCGYNEDIIDKE
jgi:hypothetical protein